MKIIKPAPAVIDWQFTCTNCKTGLEATEADVRKEKKTRFDQREGNYELTEFYVECPVCKHRTMMTPPPGWSALHPMGFT